MHQPYENLWWVEDGGHFPDVDFGGCAYSAQGSGGHYIVIVPRHELVVVRRMDTDVPGPRIGAAEMGQLLAAIVAAKSD